MKRGPFRLLMGGQIDRSRKINFRFGGKELHGFAGDSVASALLGSGVRVVARSFKFHRPRGVFSAGIEEPNALVQVGSGARAVASARAPVVPLSLGLEVFAQSGWPSLSFDALRGLDFFAPVFAAGFYNKTFMWPGWHFFEPIIRRMAGLGRAPLEADPDRYEARNAHCDALIVGGGIAGVTAALLAARAGKRVMLIDQDLRWGGMAAWDGSIVEGVPAEEWLRRSLQELQRMPDVRLMLSTVAVGCYDYGVVTLVETGAARAFVRERFWTVKARCMILATGAIEQPLVFCNNDRPGVMLAGAARRYLAMQAIAPGRHIVIATNNDSAYSLARELYLAGIKPVAMLDSRTTLAPARLIDLQAMSIPLHLGCLPIDTQGFGALSKVSFTDPAGAGKVRRLACDALLVSGGWNPSLHLLAQAGGRLRFDESTRAFAPTNPVAGIDVVGSASLPVAIDAVGPRISRWGDTSRQWVDLLHDVTVADLELASRENFSSMEHMKRFTTVGMAADQGKTSAAASVEIVASLNGCSAADFAPTTLRPPFVPVTLGAIAGRSLGERFAPARVLPVHEWHLQHGAVIEDFGEWKRPALYLHGAETRAEAIGREARAVRTAAGLFDGSPLGKIEVRGPDALKFLDRFYINNLGTLKVGLARYGIMLRESGVIFDDGIVAMLAADHFVITTTSGNAARVAAWLEEWHQCEWPQLEVVCMPVTEQWATLSLAGARSREILADVGTDIDLSNAAFPHSSVRCGRVLGLPSRVYRVSFTGELTYEINVASGDALHLCESLMKAGARYGLSALGLEALLLLRLEKGFLHVGTDTDGATVPRDVGWGKVAAAKTSDFIGRRSLSLPEYVREDRLQLVGLKSQRDMTVGSHVRLAESTTGTDGWVTSAGRTALTREPIALAVLRGGLKRAGETVDLHDEGRIVSATVASFPFFDPAGVRMNA